MRGPSDVNAKARLQRYGGLAMFSICLATIAVLQTFNLRASHDSFVASIALEHPSNVSQDRRAVGRKGHAGNVARVADQRVDQGQPEADSAYVRGFDAWAQDTRVLKILEKLESKIQDLEGTKAVGDEAEVLEPHILVGKDVKGLEEKVRKLEHKIEVWERVRDRWFDNVTDLMTNQVSRIPFVTFVTTAPRGPAEMYLRSTLNSLWASGLQEVIIAYGRPADEQMTYVTNLITEFKERMRVTCSAMPEELWDTIEAIDRPDHEQKRAKVNANAYRMYKELQNDGRHVLHLQDDIIVSSYFALRVTQLLTNLQARVGDADAYVVHLFVPYRMDKQPDVVPGLAKYVKANGFWGSQGLIYSPRLMSSGHLAQWFWDMGIVPSGEQGLDGHDITLREYLKRHAANVTLYGVKDSLVQHMGRDSSLRDEQSHQLKQVGKGIIHGYYVDDRRSERD